jgi:uncharacterized membrane protein
MVDPRRKIIKESIQSANEVCIACYCYLAIDAVWIPLCFVYLLNVLFVPQMTWIHFLVDGLDFGLIEVCDSIVDRRSLLK